MQAMAAGTIPIVTDTIGTSNYIEDRKDGLVLQGVKNHVWKYNSEYKFFQDHHTYEPSMRKIALEQLDKYFFKNTLSKDEQIKISTKAREKALKRFNNNRMLESIYPIWDKIGKINNEIKPVKKPQFHENVTTKMFSYETHPLCVAGSTNCKIFTSNGIYFSWPRNLVVDLDDLTPSTKKYKVKIPISRTKDFGSLFEIFFMAESKYKFLNVEIMEIDKRYKAVFQTGKEIQCRSILRLYVKIAFELILCKIKIRK